MEQTVFNFKGNEVRNLIIDNEPWFVGKDVAMILGYKNSRDALSKHVDKEDKKDAAKIRKINETLNKIDDEIATIDKEIVKLKDETERLEKEYEQENTLNDVVQNIRSWLKENQNMVKAIKKIDTE